MMKGFHFRLSTLLRIRESAQEQALEAYSSAIQKRLLAEGERDACKEELRRLNQSVNAMREAPFTGAQQPAYIDTLSHTEERLNEKIQYVQQAQKEELQRRDIFLRRKQEVDILQKLREKDFQAFQAYIRKQEEKQMEDNVSARFARERQ